MTTDLQIREAQPDDVPALAALYVESAEAHLAMSPDFYVVPSIGEVTRRAERDLAGDGVTLVAVVDARVVGAVDMTPLPTPTPGSMIRARRAADIGLVVSGSYRGRGIGRALMQAAEDRASRDGVELLTLTTWADNERAIGLYRSLAYETAGLLMHKWIGGR